MTGPCRVLVCRGCCCGRERGRADATSARRLELLSDLLAGTPVEVVVSHDCLGPCERSDVVVVRPGAEGRAAGGRPIWLGYTGTDACVREIAAWASAGGPGAAPAPPTLTLHEFTAPGRRATGRGRRAAG